MRKNFEDIWKKYLYESCGKHGHILYFWISIYSLQNLWKEDIWLITIKIDHQLERRAIPTRISHEYFKFKDMRAE